MEFALVLNLAKDASRKDVALALQRTAASLTRTNDPLEEGDSAPIRSTDGEVVGKWEIVE